MTYSVPAGQYGGTTKRYVDDQIAEVVGVAPSALNTLDELAEALGDNPDVITDLQDSINTVQDDVNANEIAAAQAVADLSTARGLITDAISGRVLTLEADPITATAVNIALAGKLSSDLSSLGNYVDDIAAAAGGVVVGGLYRTAEGVIKVRITADEDLTGGTSDPPVGSVLVNFIPNYSFVGTSTFAAYQNFYAGDDLFDTFGIEKVDFSQSFITLYFDSSTSMANWRDVTRQMIVEAVDPAVSETWEDTLTLDTDAEYSVNTEFDYIHYQPSELSTTELEDLAAFAANGGAGFNVIDLTLS